jgi:hypothetical protein
MAGRISAISEVGNGKNEHVVRPGRIAHDELASFNDDVEPLSRAQTISVTQQIECHETHHLVVPSAAHHHHARRKSWQTH